jgi:hypothetical protein
MEQSGVLLKLYGDMNKGFGSRLREGLDVESLMMKEREDRAQVHMCGRKTVVLPIEAEAATNLIRYTHLRRLEMGSMAGLEGRLV